MLTLTPHFHLSRIDILTIFNNIIHNYKHKNIILNFKKNMQKSEHNNIIVQMLQPMLIFVKEVGQPSRSQGKNNLLVNKNTNEY